MIVDEKKSEMKFCIGCNSCIKSCTGCFFCKKYRLDPIYSIVTGKRLNSLYEFCGDVRKRSPDCSDWERKVREKKDLDNWFIRCFTWIFQEK